MPNLSRSHDAESDERSAVEINDRVRELLGWISRTKYVLAQHEIAVRRHRHALAELRAELNRLDVRP